jgi:hypothetical protein
MEERTGYRPERPGRFRRREALRLLAASGGATVAGSLIVSQTAFADSGTVPCRFAFTGSPNAAIQTVNSANNDSITISVTGVAGACPCGGTRTVEYAYYYLTGTGTTSATGWITGSSVTAGPVALWGTGGGTVTISVGVRLTCPSPSGTTIRCRYVTQTIAIAGPTETKTTNASLATNNGTSAPPTGIPACNTGSITRQSASGGAGSFVVGGLALVAPEASVEVDPPPLGPAPADTTTSVPTPAEPSTSSPAPVEIPPVEIPSVEIPSVDSAPPEAPPITG